MSQRKTKEDVLELARCTYEILLVPPPVRIRGGTGSPVNAQAIK